MQDCGLELLNVINDYIINEDNAIWTKNELLKFDDLNVTKWLHLEKHKEFDVLIKNGEFVSCSGIFNGGRYSKNCYRLANRMFVNPKYRRNKSQFLHVKNITKIQYDRCKDQLDVIFISLKKPNNFRILKKTAETIDNNISWNLDNKFYNVVPGQYNRDCYQNVIWTSLKGNDFQLNYIEKEEYEKLPKLSN